MKALYVTLHGALADDETRQNAMNCASIVGYSAMALFESSESDYQNAKPRVAVLPTATRGISQTSRFAYRETIFASRGSFHSGAKSASE
jgi:hypothetical protein